MVFPKGILLRKRTMARIANGSPYANAQKRQKYRISKYYFKVSLKKETLPCGVFTLYWRGLSLHIVNGQTYLDKYKTETHSVMARAKLIQTSIGANYSR